MIIRAGDSCARHKINVILDMNLDLGKRRFPYQWEQGKMKGGNSHCLQLYTMQGLFIPVFHMHIKGVTKVSLY